MLRALKAKAVDVISRALQDDDDGGEWSVGRYHDPRPAEERAFCEQFSSESEVERLRRQCFEYFGIIERIEQERDGLWRMYRESVSEHLNAQALMERHLMSTRQQLARAVAMLNRMREKQDLKPIDNPGGLEPYDGEPVGSARAYAEAMISLCDKYSEALEKARPPMTDGKRERDDVDAAHR
jgi:hypothetical protein